MSDLKDIYCAESHLWCVHLPCVSYEVKGGPNRCCTNDALHCFASAPQQLHKHIAG